MVRTANLIDPRLYINVYSIKTIMYNQVNDTESGEPLVFNSGIFI